MTESESINQPALRYEYRIRWRSRRSTPNCVVEGKPRKGRTTSRLRYEWRQTEETALRLVGALQDQQDEDYCRCTAAFECGWCGGENLPPSDIRIDRREVGEFASFWP